MSTAGETIRAELAGIVGEAQISAEASAREVFAVDGLMPGCVVSPSSGEQTAQVLKCAADHGLAVLVCGGATKLGIGNPSRKYDVALCTRNLTAVRYYEPSDLTAGVGSGVRFDGLQRLLQPDGLWLPLDAAGSGHATIGGLVATNASGPLRHSYGAPRDMVVGMQVATTEGRLIRTGGRVVKNVAGYDLGKLLIGSHGTLGVITEVNLKLYPLPAQRETFVVSTGTLGIARDLRRSILASPLGLLRMVLLDVEAAGIVQDGVQAGAAGREPQMWLEAGGSPAVLERTWKELDVLCRAVGGKLRTLENEKSERAWQAISDFDNRLGKTHSGAVVLKGTLPIGNSEEFLSLAQQEAQSEKVKMASIIQPGTGILHLGLIGAQNAGQAGDLVRRIRRAAEKKGGAMIVTSASAEVKVQVDVWGSPGTGLELMRKLKAAWDPKGILAPGRFIGSI